ncbi:hypothetical protein AKN87_01825 [Thiopseudomonas alkaliphila]|uniref:Gp6-like head-tail connector protein n=1 Tax=Thiopseudomonas alkaliphila TaxID=1697053 RepID=A0A0K1XGE9_9GAMM|nr:head-tail connector protein [Thiopseudomonas alkaliphila]AKX43986.1 hypothetical protein AKN87_01825 [Thiopseudomonas alkaliphila]AKX52031.1 hypothetical protein AKN92_11510 [Thiopseudomonas alkaliphila]AKX60470.1 hypothetical protein AKN88_11435 [Thiopseudomonas alkaliphila]
MSISLKQLKNHLRLELDDQDEDENLQLILTAAIDYASKFLGRPIPWEDKLPASVTSAVLLIAADLYLNREATTPSGMKENPLVEKMLHPYRIGIGI